MCMEECKEGVKVTQGLPTILHAY